MQTAKGLKVYYESRRDFRIRIQYARTQGLERKRIKLLMDEYYVVIGLRTLMHVMFDSRDGSVASSVQSRSEVLDSIRLRDEERQIVERCFIRDFDIRNGSDLSKDVLRVNETEVVVVDPNSSKPCTKWVFPQDVHKRTMIEEVRIRKNHIFDSCLGPCREFHDHI